MSGLFALMILVSCSDGFQECRVADEFVSGYTTGQQCEQALVPFLRRVSSRGEQIFGRCLTVERASLVKGAAIIWRVDHAGDFYAEILEYKKPPAKEKPAVLAMPAPTALADVLVMAAPMPSKS